MAIQTTTTQDMISSLNYDKKDFTALLKLFIKSNSKSGNRYKMKLSSKDANVIFDKASEVLLDKLQNPVTKYNAIRLLKFSFSNTKILKERYKNIIGLIKHCILYETGNVLLELEYFVREFIFNFDVSIGRGSPTKAIKQSKIYETIFDDIANLYIFLQGLDREYQLKNEDNLDLGDLNIHGRYIYSGDTKDKFLKHVRRAIEAFSRYDFEQKMDEAGYESININSDDEEQKIENMVNLSQEQKDKLRGETGPYSEIQIKKEIRILDDKVSRTMIYIEGNINPLTFEIVKANLDKFDPELGLDGLVEFAEFRGQSHGYVIRLSPSIQYLEEEKDEIEKQIDVFSQQAQEMIIYLHKFVMNLLNIKNSPF